MDARFVEAKHGTPEQFACVQLRREVLRYPLGMDFDPAELQAESADLHLGVFVGNRCVGCLVLCRAQPRVMKMRQVAVAPDVRRSGIGSRMVAWAETRASELGVARMVLHARESAISFYLRLGYQVEGEPFEEVGLPHRAMVKPLDPTASRQA